MQKNEPKVTVKISSAPANVEDAGKVDKTKFPGYKAGAHCATCNFYQGKAGEAYGPCQIFPGKAVAGAGWCASHSPKA